MSKKIKIRLVVALIASMLSLPAILFAVNPPLTYQATNLHSESGSVEFLKNEDGDNELVEKQNEAIELLEDSVLEERITDESYLPINDDQSTEVEESIDEAKISETETKESKAFTNSLVDHPKWQDIENIVIPQENSFTPRLMHDFFVSDFVGDVGISLDRPDLLVFEGNGRASVILNNVGIYMGENINIRITIDAILGTALEGESPQISLGIKEANFLQIVIQGGANVPVEVKWEFLTDKREPIEVGTYIKSGNLNHLKTIEYSNDSIKSISSIANSVVKYRYNDNNIVMGSEHYGSDFYDLTIQALTIFEIAKQIEFIILPSNARVRIDFNQNPGAEIELNELQNIDSLTTEFTNGENISLEWSVLQEVPFITPGAWYTGFDLEYHVPDNILNSGLWNDISQIEVIVQNSLNQNVTNLFTQTNQEEMIQLRAIEKALLSTDFYGEIYKFTFRLHIDNNTSIEKDLLDESGFVVTDALVSRTSKNQRLRETISSTVANNRTNFNSMLTLNMLTIEGEFLGNQIIKDTLTHEITINPPNIEGYEFGFVKEGIDLSNIRLNSTNMSLELVYEQMIQPDIPAINPDDGTLELENTNPNNMDWLAIRYASSLDFGETTVKENGQELFSFSSITQDGREIPNMVTIQDMRPDDKRDGWQLQVRQAQELVGGAQIVMKPEVHESFLSANDLSVYEGDFMLTTDSQVFASASETNSNQIISFGMHSSEAEGVRLLIPPGMGIGSYQTTLEWNLVSGPTQRKEDFSFSFSGTEGNSEASVTRYNGSSGNVIIPREVMNTEAGWTIPTPVTSIGDGAFRNKGLTNLQIPNTVTSIGFQAIRENQLKTITLPNSLVSIGNGALEHNQLTEIEIPDTVTSIGEWAFNDNQLTSVRMSNSIQTIGDLVFRDNPLGEIIVESKFEAERMTNLLTPAVMNRVTALTILRTNEQEYFQLDNLNSKLWATIEQIEMKYFYQSENLASYSLDVLDNTFGFSNSQSTGVYKRADDTIIIYVDEETDQVDMPSYTITPIVLTTYTEAIWGATGRALQKGMNVIDNTSEGIIHIRNTSKITPSQHMKLSFEGGLSIPRYVLGETTDEEWQKAIKNRHPEIPGFELVGRQTMITGGANLIDNIQDPKAILELHDNVVDMHNETSGLYEGSDVHRLPRGLIQHLRHTIDPTAYMYAWGQHTGYNTGAMQNTVLNPSLEQWGIWHEMGHTYQVNRMNFGDLTEVTVNIYSMRAQKKLGQRSRLEVDRVYTDVFNYLDRENRNFHGLGFWEKLTMFWQLELAFGEEFYPQLHRLYREERRTLHSNMARQQYFIEVASRVSETNLVPFFEAWGIEVSSETKDSVKDYAALEKDIWYLRDEK